MLKNKRLNQNETGFASLVIALILILVLGLLTVGFAQLARREQQTALSKQLTNQAYYAAESGVNDVAQKVKAFADAGQISQDGLSVNGVSLDKTKCLSPVGSPSPNGSNLLPSSPAGTNIDTQTNTSYSCVLVDLAPPQLVFSDIAPDDQRATIFTPTPAPTTSPFSLNVSWSSASNPIHNQFPSNYASTKFMPADTWNNAAHLYPAVIQFSITPLGNGTGLDRTALINNTYTAYLYPSQSPGLSAVYNTGAGNQGQIVNAVCSGAGTAGPTCKAQVNNIPYTIAGEKYLVRFLDFYDQSNVSVDTTTLGTQFSFSQGQYVIDVTGKAQNVLKRIQVRLSQQPTNGFGTQAIEAKDICKRQQTQPATTDFIVANGSGTANGNDPCNLVN
ncbi:MAG TPA: PilX N-terminal domain-containing pilus assembly protein [Candidatus Saccharimonadales bacterium]|nr:PilX N-terminal domain-containing pilus assembly protein [Candidatus Saccharimonadales bacterium]